MKGKLQTVTSGNYDVEGFNFPETRDEFKFYSEQQIRDEMMNEDSHVTAEITRLVCLCTVQIKAYMDKLAYVPPHILRIRVNWPIEKVALQLVAEYVSKDTIH